MERKILMLTWSEQLVEFRFKNLPSDSYSYITIHIVGTMQLCFSVIPTLEVNYSSGTPEEKTKIHGDMEEITNSALILME